MERIASSPASIPIFNSCVGSTPSPLASPPIPLAPFSSPPPPSPSPPPAPYRPAPARQPPPPSPSPPTWESPLPPLPYTPALGSPPVPFGASPANSPLPASRASSLSPSPQPSPKPLTSSSSTLVASPPAPPEPYELARLHHPATRSQLMTAFLVLLSVVVGIGARQYVALQRRKSRNLAFNDYGGLLMSRRPGAKVKCTGEEVERMVDQECPT